MFMEIKKNKGVFFVVKDDDGRLLDNTFRLNLGLVQRIWFGSNSATVSKDKKRITINQGKIKTKYIKFGFIIGAFMDYLTFYFTTEGAEEYKRIKRIIDRETVK